MPVPQSTEATLDNQSLASLECLSQSNFQAHAQHAQHLRKSIGGEVRQDKDAAALPDPSSDIDADSALLPSFSRKLSAAEINCLKSLADSAAGQEEIIAVQNEDNKRQNSFIANQDAMLAILGEHAANAEGLIASQNKLLALQKDRVANLQKAISDVEQEKLLLAFLSYIAADCIVNVLNEAQCLPSLRAPLWTLKFAIASNLTC